jgi:hypothetical protein
MRRLWEVPGYKPSTAEFQVSLDLTTWLGTETIEAVTFSAKKLSDGSTDTTNVLDADKNAYTAVLVKPWIKGGTSGETYHVKMAVTTNEGTKDTFIVQFAVYDY